nr:hypothetical protein [Tanacetum cinerariifolium]
MEANKQFQIAQPIEEPQKKKRKITPKIKSGPVVKNEVTERLQKFITGDEMNGSEPKLVIQKVLYMSNLKQDQNRLSLPLKKLEIEDFLTIEEKLALENENEIEVRLVGPTLKMYKEPMSDSEFRAFRSSVPCSKLCSQVSKLSMHEVKHIDNSVSGVAIDSTSFFCVKYDEMDPSLCLASSTAL